jgi:hypothetical protein
VAGAPVTGFLDPIGVALGALDDARVGPVPGLSCDTSERLRHEQVIAR